MPKSLQRLRISFCSASRNMLCVIVVCGICACAKNDPQRVDAGDASEAVEARSPVEADEATTTLAPPANVEPTPAGLVLTAAEVKQSGEDWPSFLGPREAGVSGESGFADRCPADGPPINWEKRIKKS